MKRFAAICGIALFAATPALAQPMEMDRPVQMGDLTVACSGIGSAKDDPQWKDYPIRIEFSNGGAQYLSGAHVVLMRGAKTVADFDCPGAWVLLKGPAGPYRVDATIDNSQAKPVNAPFDLGAGAQKRVVLRFPDFQANQ
jgi:hypothetical protein